MVAVLSSGAAAEDGGVLGALALPSECVVFGPFTAREAPLPEAYLTEIPETIELGEERAVGRAASFGENRVLDLRPFLDVEEGEPATQRVAIVHVPFVLAEAGPVSFGFGADWWYEAYVNGELVSSTMATGNGSWPPTIGDFGATVELAAGDHLLVVRFVSGTASSLLAVGGPDDLRKLPPPPPDPGPRLTPVTLGDAVIEPFFDGVLGAWSHWTLEPGDSSARALQRWCNVQINWVAADAGQGPVLYRRYPDDGVALGPYTQLVLSAGFPLGTVVSLRAETDAGEFARDIVCGVSHTDQFVLPLPGAARLLRVEVGLGSAGAGRIEGSLIWLGARDPVQAEAEGARWRLFSEQPLDVFLRPTPVPLDGAPMYHVLASPEGFAQAREAARAAGVEPLGLRASVALEPHLSGGANQNLFGRRTEAGHRGLVTAAGRRMSLLQAAQQAALAEDHESLREVAKAAVQFALIPHWDVDFITAFPDSAWEQRPFSQAVVCYHLAVALDLAGPWFSDAGRALVLRRLAEDGLGNINHSVWRHPYIFNCNQLAVFSMGRLAVYSVLEKQRRWARVEPYTDLAFAELNESLEKIFLPDGGFYEGTGYLSYTLDNALPALAIYGAAREKPLADLLPPLLAKVDDYLEVLRSTTRNGRVLILVADAQGGPFASPSASQLSVLAKLRPGGAAARMLASIPDYADQLELWARPAPDLAEVDPNHYAAFVSLPDTGMVASTRRFEDEWVKLVVFGGPARAGHNHEDRGSFVLEFAGDTFAADPGGLIYADAAANAMKHAQNHNMLVPVVAGPERPAPQNPASVAVIPEARGNEVSFSGFLAPGVLWPRHYRRWERSFGSPNPAEFVIVDEYELEQGEGVEFLWHTPLPVRIENGEAVIQGVKGRAYVTPQAGSRIEVIPPRRLGTSVLSTLVIRRDGQAGSLTTRVRLTRQRAEPRDRVWQGASPVQESDRAAPGTTGWVWDAYNNGRGGQMRLELIEDELAGKRALAFDLHASQAAPGTQVTLVVTSPGPNGRGDYYVVRFPVDWQGPRRFELPLASFSSSRSPAGWDAATEIILYSLHGGPPKDPVELVLSGLEFRD